MLHAVAVDDELRALQRFERIIKQEESITLIGSFTKPQEAMEFIKSHEVDVVFLDIEMPKVSGLELAERIFEEKPGIDVVFITAYDKYALQAFQVHAIGYLLKPVDLEDVKNQTANLMRRRMARKHENVEKKLSIQCLGKFLCFPEGSEHERIHWRTSKAEELFAFLVHSQGNLVSKERIIETLWSEMDEEKASKNLHATCYYIRNVLSEKGFEDVFIRSRGCYQVKLSRLNCDVLEFLSILEAISKGVGSTEILERADWIYKGAYLDDKPYEWSMNMRSWLEHEHEKLLFNLAKAHKKDGNLAKEADILKKIIYLNPLADEAYHLLVDLSFKQGDKASAVLYYKKYEKVLKEELGIHPSEHLVRLMDNLL